jgi:hypothetical protein
MTIFALRGSSFVCLLDLAALQTTHAQTARPAADQAPPLEQLEAPIPGSLYVRMGGAHNVQALAADMIDHVSKDPRTERPFEKVNLTQLKSLLAVKFCELTGGGCKYTGDSMHQDRRQWHGTAAGTRTGRLSRQRLVSGTAVPTEHEPGSRRGGR